jgi:hypothetical protein
MSVVLIAWRPPTMKLILLLIAFDRLVTSDHDDYRLLECTIGVAPFGR